MKRLLMTTAFCVVATTAQAQYQYAPQVLQGAQRMMVSPGWSYALRGQMNANPMWATPAPVWRPYPYYPQPVYRYR